MRLRSCPHVFAYACACTDTFWPQAFPTLPKKNQEKKRRGPEWIEIHPQVPARAMFWFLTAIVPQSQAEGRTHAKFFFCFGFFSALDFGSQD